MYRHSRAANRRKDNFVAFELKLAARPQQAAQAFGSLDAIVAALNYPMAILVNVASEETHAGLYRGEFADRMHCFAVQLRKDVVQIRYDRPESARTV